VPLVCPSEERAARLARRCNKALHKGWGSAIGHEDAEAAQSHAQMQRAPVLLAPGLEGTDFRRGEGLGGPSRKNKRCLEDAVPGKPKKIGSRRIADNS
jgi:hypothetical protein